MVFDMFRRFIKIANLLLITAAVFFCVKLFYQFVALRLDSSISNMASVRPEPVAREGKSRPTIDNYRAIVERDLFDTDDNAEEKTLLPEIDLEAIEKTKLNLKLRGTVTADAGKSITARAVIEGPKSGRQGLYQIGDTIQHATISEIFRKSVVLDVNGKKEKLSIEEKDGFQRVDATMPAFSRHEQKEVLPQPKTGRQISLKRSRIDEALNNINQLMSEVKIRPYFQTGAPAGFLVSSISPDSIVRDMGLKTGDIVTGINGQDIQTVNDAMVFYEKLQAGEAISLELQRRGRREIINYVLEGEEIKP